MMGVYIKEWPNKTATIMTADGQVIWTFSSRKEASRACAEWQRIIRHEAMEEMATDGSGISGMACLT